MAKVKFKNLNKAFKQLSKEFDNFLGDREQQKKIAKTLQNELKNNIRREGKDANDKKLPALRPSTIANRKRLAQSNSTLSSFQPSRSNLTITGQLVRSLKVFIGRLKGQYEMTYTGVHKPYKNKSGKRPKRVESTTNEEIISHIRNNKYNTKWKRVKFYGATKRAKERIMKQFRRYIRRRKR